MDELWSGEKELNEAEEKEESHTSSSDMDEEREDIDANGDIIEAMESQSDEENFARNNYESATSKLILFKFFLLNLVLI